MPRSQSGSIRTDVVASRIAQLAYCLSCAVLCASCDKLWPTGTRPQDKSGVQAAPPVEPSSSAAVPAERAPPTQERPEPLADAGSDAGTSPHPGPWLTVLVGSAAVYAQPNGLKESKIGYVQSGARLAVTGTQKPGEGCSAGWLTLVDGGFVCSSIGTLDEKDARVRFAQRAPDTEALLPYTYARNVKNGTPMYRTVPTREEMDRYEPYLREEAEAKARKEAEAKARKEQDAAPLTSASPEPARANSLAPLGSVGNPAPTSTTLLTPAVPANAEEPTDLPWWQRENAQDRLHEMKLADLRSDSDDVLIQRMVRGFYVAVDRTFRWHGRTWYKTTKRMVVPADRFGVATPSDFQGVELGADWQLPIAWVHGAAESIGTYEIERDKKLSRQAGRLKHFEAVQLTGEALELRSVKYLAIKGGKWVKQSQVRATAPGPAPEGLQPDEPWLDVNLTQQTLVAFRGMHPVFATLLSSGKSSKIKEKDHSTPVGSWRIREKHVTTTMDGDGTAAGDLPYSIEDVPYVMYFFRAYAVHGAFWHRNYGVQMSHGCINLAPLDAKRVFFFTEPHIPAGWHGIWSSSAHPGSWIVVHE